MVFLESNCGNLNVESIQTEIKAKIEAELSDVVSLTASCSDTSSRRLLTGAVINFDARGPVATTSFTLAQAVERALLGILEAEATATETGGRRLGVDPVGTSTSLAFIRGMAAHPKYVSTWLLALSDTQVLEELEGALRVQLLAADGFERVGARLSAAAQSLLASTATQQKAIAVEVEFIARGFAIDGTKETIARQIGRVAYELQSWGSGSLSVLSLPTVMSAAGAPVSFSTAVALVSPAYDAAVDFTQQGLKIGYTTNLQTLKKCRDWKGQSAVAVESTMSGTEYTLGMAVTFITAEHAGNAERKQYKSVCKDVEYKLEVNSEMLALTSFSGSAGGGQGGTVSDHTYLQSANYVSCTAACDPLVGPQHECPSTPPDPGAAVPSLRQLEYVVHLDLADEPGTGGATKTTFMVMQKDEVLVGSAQGSATCGGNCYGVTVAHIQRSQELGFTRTAVTFRSSCLSLIANASDPTGRPVADAFSTCKSCPQDATNFDFSAKLTACEEETGGGNTIVRCRKVRAPLSVSVAQSYEEQADSISFQVKHLAMVYFQNSFIHFKEWDNNVEQAVTRPPGDYDSYHNTTDDIDAWRGRSTLQPGEDGQYSMSDKDVLVVGMGFKPGAPAEEVMVGTIRMARLGVFKEHCVHTLFDFVLLSSSSSGSTTVCTFANTILDGTHSPFVKLASESDCITDDCRLAIGAGVVAPGQTLESEVWEKFLIDVFTVHKSAGTFGQDLLPEKIQSFVGAENDIRTFDISVMVQLNPTLESQTLIEDGKVTQMAELTYGSCEKNMEQGIIANVGGMDINQVFPTGEDDDRFGVCTCKGMLAYQFEQTVNGVVTNPHREDRSVVYDEQTQYSTNLADAASLHLCPLLNYPLSASQRVVTSSDTWFFGGLNKLDPTKMYLAELKMVQSTTGLTSSTAPARRLQSTETTSLFALGMGRASSAIVAQEPLQRADYSQSSSGSFRVNSSAPVGTRIHEDDNKHFYLLYAFLSPFLFFPQVFVPLIQLVQLLCYPKSKEWTWPCAICAWGVSIAVGIVFLLVSVLAYTGDNTPPDNDIILPITFVLASVVPLSVLVGLNECKRNTWFQDVLVRFRLVHAAPTEITTEITTKKSCACMGFISGLIGIFAVIGALEPFKTVDNPALNWIAWVLVLAVILFRIYEVTLSMYTHFSTNKIQMTNGDGPNASDLSPFGCVVQVAHTLPIGAGGLKTAGVTRPASQFKVN